ncbi:MAG: hypothetical protein Q8N98_01195, partial [bacterium]|nr:hypothetical protein [bacterium]
NFVMGNIAAAYVRFDPLGNFQIDPTFKDDLRSIFYPAARELARCAKGPVESIERLKETWEIITYLVLADPAAHERGLPFPDNSPFFKETSDLADLTANPGKDAVMLVYGALQKMKVLRE